MSCSDLGSVLVSGPATTFTQKVELSHAPTSARVFVLNDPRARSGPVSEDADDAFGDAADDDGNPGRAVQVEISSTPCYSAWVKRLKRNYDELV
jgi:hypothetical protein